MSSSLKDLTDTLRQNQDWFTGVGSGSLQNTEENWYGEPEIHDPTRWFPSGPEQDNVRWVDAALFIDIGIDEPTDSPFDDLEVLYANETTEILASIDLSGRHDQQEICDRLKELFELSAEEPEQLVMSPSSLSQLVHFLRTYTTIKTPLLFLLESGVVRAEWRASAREALALEFHSDGIVRFILFAPETKRPSLTTVLSGRRPWWSVMATISQGADLSWLYLI